MGKLREKNEGFALQGKNSMNQNKSEIKPNN